MQIYFYQAECGDAARIRYIGNDNIPHNIFIDSGYERTYKHAILKEIITIIENREDIDLWVVSHIHDDHIGGIIKYLKAIGNGEINDIARNWYYNSPRPNYGKEEKLTNSSISSAASIFQGDKLFEYLKKNDRLLDFDINTELLPQDIFGLKLFILSPTVAKLNSLRQKYKKSEFLPFEKNELDSISEAVSPKGYDYNILLDDFDISEYEEDDSIENGSSISLLTELNGIKILWLADSHPSDVINSLKNLGYSKKNQLNCDWVKVTHHGSKGNNSHELYKLIKCNNYLISSNGENKSYLPSKEALARIIRNESRNKDSVYNFYFTYDNPILRSMFKVDGKDTFDKWKFNVEYSSEKYFEIIL